jgi:phenylpyruvate tautomerase PptA (4-oxalocrotonate tautomerase family)
LSNKIYHHFPIKSTYLFKGVQIKAGHFTHVIIDEVRASHYRIVMCTCVSAGVLYSLGIKAGHFTHVIIDEVRASHYRIVVCTCVSAGVLYSLGIKAGPNKIYHHFPIKSTYLFKGVHSN